MTKGRRKKTPLTEEQKARQEAKRKQYEKTGSKWSRMTDEQKAEHLARTRLRKQNNRHRIDSHGKVKPGAPPPVGKTFLGQPKPGTEAWYKMLKEKHG